MKQRLCRSVIPPSSQGLSAALRSLFQPLIDVERIKHLPSPAKKGTELQFIATSGLP